MMEDNPNELRLLKLECGIVRQDCDRLRQELKKKRLLIRELKKCLFRAKDMIDIIDDGWHKKECE